jgi:hypothetical protein
MDQSRECVAGFGVLRVLWWVPTIANDQENQAKMRLYGRCGQRAGAKTTGFPGQIAPAKKGGIPPLEKAKSPGKRPLTMVFDP